MNLEELKTKIIAANKAYRSGDALMSDQMFDDLCEQYQNLVSEEEYNAFRDSLHETEGKVKHPFIMGSLDKLKYEEPKLIEKFINKQLKKDIFISAKVDGISCRLHYEDGKLVSASTRGSGWFGEDVSDKIAYVKCIPSTIQTNDKIVDVRGELVILKDDFVKMSGFANARNACAGIMNRKDFAKVDVSKVSFIAYTVLGPKYTKEEQFKLLEDNSFKTAWHLKLPSKTYFEENELDIADELLYYAMQSFEYETDGLVICDSTYVNEDKYRPDACKAFKINMLTATTKIIDVDFGSPSKNGFFCPVAVLEPVELGGSTISRASIHNLDYINEKNLKYGSVVKILKSGDIIPKIIAVVSNDNTTDINLPKICNCCGTPLVKDGVNLRCTNKRCEDQVVLQLKGFIKKLGIKNCSEASLKSFGIKSYDDLFSFKPNKHYKMQVKLYDELLSKMFTRSKQTLLAALDFCGLGTKLVNKIVNFYGYSNVEAGSYKGLPAGVGEITLQKFQKCILENLDIVNKIIQDSRYNNLEVNVDNTIVNQNKSNNNGISVCFTGKLNTMTRSEASKKAEAVGFEVKGGVNKGLTYLVTNDTESGSSKNRKAKELGTTIISEEDFLKLIETTQVNVNCI